MAAGRRKGLAGDHSSKTHPARVRVKAPGGNPDKIQNPKRRLAEAFQRHSGKPYNDRLHTAQIARAVPDCTRLRHSPSFRLFAQSLTRPPPSNPTASPPLSLPNPAISHQIPENPTKNSLAPSPQKSHSPCKISLDKAKRPHAESPYSKGQPKAAQVAHQTHTHGEPIMLQAWNRAWESFKGSLGWLSPPVLGSLYAIAIALSILFDFIYLRALGISIMVAPTSIADHIRSSMIWIPPVLIAAIVAITCSAIWSYFYEVSIRDRPQATIFQRLIDLFCSTLSNFFLMVALVGVFSLALLAMWCLIWYFLAPYDFSSIKDKLEIIIRIIILIGVIFILSFMGIGIFCHGGSSDSNRIQPRILLGVTSIIFTIFLVITTYAVARSSENEVDCSSIRASSLVFISNNGDKSVLLRSFGNHFLVFNCGQNRKEFLRTDEADSIIVHE